MVGKGINEKLNVEDALVELIACYFSFEPLNHSQDKSLIETSATPRKSKSNSSL